jgi:hypothetical protein
MTARLSGTGGHRELAAACAATLLGALCVLLATGQRWLPGRETAVSGPVTGDQIVPVARALGLVALAGVVALLAARRWTRVAVGLALAAGGLAVIGSTVPHFGSAAFAWPALTLVGGVLLVAAGLLTTLRGRMWPAVGARYEAPSAGRPGDHSDRRDLWAALDRGEDPTAQSPHR